jgi:predicted AAA+ superfamily ATPase
MKYRVLVDVIKGRLAEERPLIQVVIGPRQVGKTTAMRAAIGDGCVYETADLSTSLPVESIGKWWDAALESTKKILAIDEIQKIPDWTEAVKRLWDKSDRKLKLVVTGSSSLLLGKGLKESLAGRFEMIRAEHWNLSEARDIFGFSIEKFVEFGCYPGSVEFLDRGLERWGQYIHDSIMEPAIGRDLLQLHPVDQPALLRQIMGVAASLPCQVVSLQKLQGQLQGKGSLPTIQNYLRLLAEAFLVTGIEKYSPVPIRMKKSSPKLIVHDNALVRAFERPVAGPLSPERFGHYFENAVGARLIEAGWDVFYWKDRDVDVDFVVISPEGEKLAIEVKSSVATEKDISGLKRFCSIYPDFTPCLISLIGQKVGSLKSLGPVEMLGLSRKY